MIQKSGNHSEQVKFRMPLKKGSRDQQQNLGVLEDIENEVRPQNDEPVVLLSSKDIRSIERTDRAVVGYQEILYIPLWIVLQLVVAFQNGILSFEDFTQKDPKEFTGEPQIDGEKSQKHLDIAQLIQKVVQIRLYNKVVVFLIMVQALLLFMILINSLNNSKKNQAVLLVQLCVPISSLLIFFKGVRVSQLYKYDTFELQQQSFETFENQFYQFMLMMALFLQKQTIKKSLVKLEIQIIAMVWFVCELLLNCFVNFRVIHVTVTLKFLLFWVLLETIIKPIRNSPDKKFQIEFDSPEEKKVVINGEKQEEDTHVRRYRSDNVLTNLVKKPVNLELGVIQEECNMCLEKAISFDMSINKIMGSISDCVIIISPAKLQNFVGDAKSPMPFNHLDSVAFQLSMYLTDQNQRIFVNNQFKEMIQRYAFLDKDKNMKFHQMNLLSIEMFEKPLTQRQKNANKKIQIKQVAGKDSMNMEMGGLMNKGQNQRKLSLIDLTHSNFQNLRIESQKSRLDYFLNKQKINVPRGRNQTSDLSTLFKKTTQPQNIIEKDTYDTFVEDIFMKNEMHKIIIFRQKPNDGGLIDGALKVINDHQNSPKKRLTKEQIIREIVSNSSMSNADFDILSEKEKEEHKKLKIAIDAQKNIVSRKDSALKKYKFDQIMEAEDEEDEGSSQDTHIRFNRKVLRNSTQNNLVLQSFSNNFVPISIVEQSQSPADKNRKINVKQRQPNQIKNNFQMQKINHYDDEFEQFSDIQSEDQGHTIQVEQIYIAPPLEHLNDSIEYKYDVKAHQSQQINSCSIISSSNLIPLGNRNPKISEELLKFQQRFGLLDNTSNISDRQSNKNIPPRSKQSGKQARDYIDRFIDQEQAKDENNSDSDSSGSINKSGESQKDESIEKYSNEESSDSSDSSEQIEQLHSKKKNGNKQKITTLKVLIADDIQQNITLLRDNLTQYTKKNTNGIQRLLIDEAHDGKEAYEKAIATQFDVIFMDDYMPNLNGNEATKKIVKYQKKKGQEVSIIVLTADQTTQVDDYIKQKLKQIALQSGAFNYISKPLKYETISQTLDNVVCIINNN